MVTNNHYRWDFIGLSTDEKPTPATSDKVVDGSTYYCSDTSKLYVYCKDNWYERKSLGGGGGSYSAGDGINIANNTISVDTTTIQPKLTAGTGIDITDNTISATGGGGGGITELTSADYNYPENNPDGVALWSLTTGEYTFDNIKVYLHSSSAITNARGYVFIETAADTISLTNTCQILYTDSTGSFFQGSVSSGTAINLGVVLKDNIIQQSTGTSTTKVMSQNATTSMVFADPGTNEKVQIGSSASSTGTFGVAIGGASNTSGAYGVSIGYNSGAKVNGVAIGDGAKGGMVLSQSEATAVGYDAQALAKGSVALGAKSTTSSVGEMNIGSSDTTYGYNSTNYRLLSGVHDPVDAHDAATKGYVDATAGVKTLTSDDYNFPSTNPSVIAPWLLPVGQYQIAPNTDVLPDGNSSSYSGTDIMGILVLTQALSSGSANYGSFILSSSLLNHFYKVQYNGTPVTGFPHEL